MVPFRLSGLILVSCLGVCSGFLVKDDGTYKNTRKPNRWFAHDVREDKDDKPAWDVRGGTQTRKKNGCEEAVLFYPLGTRIVRTAGVAVGMAADCATTTSSATSLPSRSESDKNETYPWMSPACRSRGGFSLAECGTAFRVCVCDSMPQADLCAAVNRRLHAAP